MSKPVDELLTVSRIAERLNVARHRVEYIIRSRRIEPTGSAGIARIFSAADLRAIESELARIETEREGVSHES